MRTDQESRIAVVGPGGIGSLFAAHLAWSGCPVVLIDKDPHRARVLSASGIRIGTGAGEIGVSIPVTAEPEEFGLAGVVCICVKAFDTAAAVLHAAPLIGEHTTVVSIQNGLGNAEAVARRVDSGRIVCAVTGQAATVIEPGRIRHAGTGMTRMAALAPGGRDRADAFARHLRAAGLPAHVHADARPMLWSKLVVNAAINPLTALHGVPNGALLDDPAWRGDLRRAAAEGQAVARAKGIVLRYGDAAAETEAVCAATRDNLSSMLQDIRRGRRPEIEEINGAIVAEADALGVDVPVLRRLLLAVRRMVGGGA